MAWDVDAARGSDPIGITRKLLVGNFTALQSVLSGTHTFPGTSGTHGMHTPGQTPICEVDTEAVISGYTDIAGSICWPTNLATFYTNNGSSWDGRGAFSGTVRMIFFQATAPVGWTILTTADDGMIYSTNVAANGGTELVGGTWTIAGLEHSHYHTYSQIPYHKHNVYCGWFVPNGGLCWSDRSGMIARYTSYYDTQTSYNTASSSGTISSNGNWRPKRAISIIATKD